MATSVTFNGTTYSIPASGEVAWASLSLFLIDVANNAQTTGKAISNIRVATSTPVTVATTDYTVVTNLASPGAVAVALPTGTNGQVFVVVDGKGDAGTNNITVSGTGQNIDGAASFVIDVNYGFAVFQFSTTAGQWLVTGRYKAVVDGDVKAGAGLAWAKMAALTASRATVTDGSGEVGVSAVTATELGYLTGVSSAVQTQLDAKIPATEKAAALGVATLNASGKLDNTQIPDALVGALVYQGTWNASTNSPALASGTGTKGRYYVVSTTGTTALDGVSDWVVGDWLVYNGTAWEKVDNSDKVSSVAGKTGVVTISLDDLSDATITSAATGDRVEHNGTAFVNTSGPATFTEQGSTPASPAAGKGKLYPKTDGSLYYLNASGVETPVGSGASGSGEINLIANPSATTATTGWAVSGAGSPTVTRLTSGAPLDPTITTGLRMGGGSATAYIYYNFTLPASLTNKKLKIEWHQLAPTSGDWKVDMYTQAGSRYALSTDSSAVTAIPAAAGRFTTTFDSDSTTTLQLRFTRVAGTGNLDVASVIVGPGSVVTGAAVTEWQSYTPTFQGFGSPTAIDLEWRRNGSNMEVRGRFTAGNGTGVEARVYLPSGHTIRAATSGATFVVGTAATYIGAAQLPVVLGTGGHTYLRFGRIYGTEKAFTAVTDTGFTVNGEIIGINASVPIAEWAGSGTVNMGAGAQVEYASNNGSAGAAAGGAYTTGQVYGPNGSTFPSVASTTADSSTQYAVDFQTPISTTNPPWIEVSQDSGVTWHREGGTLTNIGRVRHATGDYGMWLVPVSATRVNVCFGNYGRFGSTTTYGAAGGAWSSIAGNGTYLWRVVKANPSSPVGFGLASATQSGLVSTGTQTFSGIKNNASTPAFRAYLATSFTFFNGTGGGTFQVAYDGETFDQGGNYNNTSTYKFTCPSGGDGIYFFTASMLMDGGDADLGAGDTINIHLRKGSTIFKSSYNENADGNDQTVQVNGLVSLVAGDTVDVVMNTNSANSLTVAARTDYSTFEGFKIC